MTEQSEAETEQKPHYAMCNSSECGFVEYGSSYEDANEKAHWHAHTTEHSTITVGEMDKVDPHADDFCVVCNRGPDDGDGNVPRRQYRQWPPMFGLHKPRPKRGGR